MLAWFRPMFDLHTFGPTLGPLALLICARGAGEGLSGIDLRQPCQIRFRRWACTRIQAHLRADSVQETGAPPAF